MYSLDCQNKENVSIQRQKLATQMGHERFSSMNTVGRRRMLKNKSFSSSPQPRKTILFTKVEDSRIQKYHGSLL